MQQHNDYSQFTERDFICDQFFQDWVLVPSQETNDFWNEWLKSNPGKAQIVLNAKKLLESIRFTEHWPAEEKINAALQEAFLKIDEGGIAPRTGLIARMRWTRRIAAIFTGLVLIGAAYYFLRDTGSNRVEYATEFGKMDTIVLPDKSVVILNANSRLHFQNNWNKITDREVWLEGEAFFDVKHFNMDAANIKPGERFRVHTKDLTIEVLGTTFDVRQRRSKTEVVLQTGSIKIILKNGQQTILQPGDLFSYDSLLIKPVLTKVIPENYSGWKNKNLILPNPTVENIIQYLEDNYGKRIILKDTSMRGRIIEGPVDIDNLRDGLFILSVILKVDIVKENDTTLVLKPRN